jgi:hypothetical protein
MFNLSINEDVPAHYSTKVPGIGAVRGLHDDITILANRREDFGKYISKQRTSWSLF